jgi:hypothetical protein
MKLRGLLWFLSLHERLVAALVVVSLFGIAGTFRVFYGSWGIDLLWWVRRW